LVLEFLIVLAVCLFAGVLATRLLGVVGVVLVVFALAVALPAAGVLGVFALPLRVDVRVLREVLGRRPRPAATITA
jgi:hypothetical protein